MPTDEAIVLVGGLGTRLRPVVEDVPKPLAPVAGRPFLAWILDHLAAEGIRHVILASGHMAEQVEHRIGRRWRDIDVEYSVESEPLGTGGALRLAAKRLRTGAAHAINGDTFLRYHPADLERAVRMADAELGLALAQVEDAARYGAVESEAGWVTGFKEKGRSGPAWINAGCYFLTERAMARLPDMPRFSFEHEVLEPLARQRRVLGFGATRDFIDIGVPEDYRRAQDWFRGGNDAHERIFIRDLA